MFSSNAKLDLQQKQKNQDQKTWRWVKYNDCRRLDWQIDSPQEVQRLFLLIKSEHHNTKIINLVWSIKSDLFVADRFASLAFAVSLCGFATQTDWKLRLVVYLNSIKLSLISALICIRYKYCILRVLCCQVGSGSHVYADFYCVTLLK